MIQLQHLFELKLWVEPIVEIGQTPYGQRRISPIKGGSFQGERLSGHVHASPAGDWLLVRNDGVLTLNVRITLECEDHALIYMSYEGLRHGPQEVMDKLAKGEPVEPGSYYFRMAPKFETASPQHAYLNKMLAIATGHRDPVGPTYQVYEVL
jgi:hypothetical protein